MRKFGIPVWEKNKFNPTTTLDPEADAQALLFSARQEPYNLEWLDKWIEYAGESHWCCKKRLSDAPELKAAVSREQALVVCHQIRSKEMKFNLRIPEAMTKIIITYYTQPAIYPTPRWMKYQPPRRPPYKLSWKIHDKESYKDPNHAFNVGDHQSYKEWKQTNFDGPRPEKRGLYRSWQRKKLHPWHC